MDKIKYFNIACNDEEWLSKLILSYNEVHETDFKLEEMLHWEVIFAKISTEATNEEIFRFSKYITHFEMIEYIEGRI